MRVIQFISAISVVGLLAACVATVPPPLPPNNPADPQVRSSSRFPQLFARDETTREIERELSATADNARSADSMHHEGHDMQSMEHSGMQHGDMKMEASRSEKEHAGMQHSPTQQPEKKSIAEEMKKTSDEMKATSDAMKKKSNALKAGAPIYTCPMHPEVQSDKPGNCPKCGMKLVAKEPAHEGH